MRESGGARSGQQGRAMIRALVVDDEDLPRYQLCKMLSESGEFDIVESRDGIEALERMEEFHPDVLFLDIEMPGMTGFELLDQLRRPPAVVFVTAYDEYAIKAFDANALDYLLKPVEKGRLTRTVDRLRGTLERGGTQAHRVRQVLRDLRPGAPARLAVHKQKRIVLLPLRAVLWAGVELRLVFVHTVAERYLSNRTIGELEEMLCRGNFYRINRSELVNLDHVREMAPWTSGTCRLTLTNGTELSVSRDRVPQLKSLVGL